MHFIGCVFERILLSIVRVNNPLSYPSQPVTFARVYISNNVYRSANHLYLFGRERRWLRLLVQDSIHSHDGDFYCLQYALPAPEPAQHPSLPAACRELLFRCLPHLPGLADHLQMLMLITVPLPFAGLLMGIPSVAFSYFVWL